MSEDLTTYMKEAGIKVNYLHSEIKTLERIEIIRDLRMGTYDAIVGINLLERDRYSRSFIGCYLRCR